MLSFILAMMLPPCDFEDGSTQSACYWDSSESGNRDGADVVNLNYGEMFFTVDNN